MEIERFIKCLRKSQKHSIKHKDFLETLTEEQVREYFLKLVERKKDKWSKQFEEEEQGDVKKRKIEN